MAGEHNALNAAAAAVLAHAVGAPWPRIAEALGSFAGLDRRMERLGTRPVRGGDVTVYDDYGHHPTEIDATLRAIRAAEQPQRLICVFQPHQHSRTSRFCMSSQTVYAGRIVLWWPALTGRASTRKTFAIRACSRSSRR